MAWLIESSNVIDTKTNVSVASCKFYLGERPLSAISISSFASKCVTVN